jgi:hypothetical protein
MRPLPDHPIRDRSAWLTRDLDDPTTWTTRLDDGHLAEIDRALAHAKTRGRDWRDPDFSRADFPLDRAGELMDDLLEELEDGRGFVLLRGLDVTRYSEDDATTVYRGLGAWLGDVISQNSQGDLIGRVTDHGDRFAGDDPYKAGVRGHRTRIELQPHTDTSDLVGLLCIRPAKSGGRSHVASSTAIFNEIQRTRPDLLPVLARGFHIDLVGKGRTADEITANRIPVFSWYEGKLSCRFNTRQFELGQEKAGEPLSGAARQAVDLVRALSIDPRFRLAMDFRPGDIQVLNNHVTLHARDAYEDDPAARRLLLRLWLNVPNGRPLAPEFADRLNSGARGGVTVRG